MTELACHCVPAMRTALWIIIAMSKKMKLAQSHLHLRCAWGAFVDVDADGSISSICGRTCYHVLVTAILRICTPHRLCRRCAVSAQYAVLIGHRWLQAGAVAGRFGFSWPSPGGWTDFRPFQMFRGSASRDSQQGGSRRRHRDGIRGSRGSSPPDDRPLH